MGEVRVNVKKKNITWAFDITDLDVDRKDSIIEKNKWLRVDEKNYLNPTVKQLGKFANDLHVPFGNLLLEEIPRQEDIKLAFRTKNNAPAQVSLNVREIIYEMQRKQAWFKEESGYAQNKIEIIGIVNNNNFEESLRQLSYLLKLSHFKTARDLFNDLRNQIANHGVLVMQKGGAGLGNNRPIDTNELRAFVILDDYAPLIFVNQKESYTARIFSLIHEFIHILRGTDELLSGKEHDLSEERFINNITASFLMPEIRFIEKFDKENIEKTARYFNVSPESAAIRAQTLNLVKKASDLSYYDGEPTPRKSSGGDPYNKVLSFNDNRFMAALFGTQNNGSLPPTKAASLLGMSTKMLDRAMNTFYEREAKV